MGETWIVVGALGECDRIPMGMSRIDAQAIFARGTVAMVEEILERDAVGRILVRFDRGPGILDGPIGEIASEKRLVVNDLNSLKLIGLPFGALDAFDDHPKVGGFLQRAGGGLERIRFPGLGEELEGIEVAVIVELTLDPGWQSREKQAVGLWGVR